MFPHTRDPLPDRIFLAPALRLCHQHNPIVVHFFSFIGGMTSYEMKSRAEVRHNAGIAEFTEDRDDFDLARIGKKAVLKVKFLLRTTLSIGLLSFCQRNFSVLSILAFSCTIIATWEGLLE
jgi:hypothetical protein